MPWFIKTETFTKTTQKLSKKDRQKYIQKHKDWVIKKNNSGLNIISGYLIDKNGNPGGGGILFLQATSYKEAESIIKEDPMINNNLVTWEIHQWVSTTNNQIELN